jgi:undecaprenyl diphosphate synthase
MEQEKFQQIAAELQQGRMPKHVAIIMDGNGRWAQARGMERTRGHVEGVESVINITRACSELGIGYLTLYGFSTENWNRPQSEVDMLMHLIGITVEQQTPYLVENNVKLNIIGDMPRIPEASRERLQRSVEATAHCTGMVMTMALSYSARWEITEAVKHIALAAQQGRIDATSINDNTIEQYLSTYPIPDPDLLIRTGGETRISNFLLWQCAYSEFYFTPIYWPEFREEAMIDAIREYQHRERRFGKTSKQVSNSSSNYDK